MNSGAGVSSELKIGGRLKLATGISLGQNSVKFNQSIPKEAALNLDKTISSMNNTQLESNDQQPITAAGFSRNTISSYNASLLGFDIPVNLKYALLQRKNSIYLITGLSSNVFIRESYTYNFNSRSIKDQENTDSFQSFNFARVLNLSMGFEYPFSNKTIISVEPFLKYPLSGLGSHDLRFRAAGMNLKFNFNR
jgi:hypothetical protein